MGLSNIISLLKIKKNELIWILLLLSHLTWGQGKYATGLILDENTYSQISPISPALQFADYQPEYSLRRFCPTPGNQGQIGSCTGWATGYAAMTIAEAVKSGNTNQLSITNNARSAMFVYLSIVQECPGGSSIEKALELAKFTGVCRQRDFANGLENCFSTIPSNLLNSASKFRIKDYNTLFPSTASADQKIIAIRNSIRSNDPVIASVDAQSLEYVGANGFWDPYGPGDNRSFHAICVIGYNDNTETFEIINSWGQNWGNKGFFTISYSDFAERCRYAYRFSLDQIQVEPEVNLTGTFKFLKMNQSGSFYETQVKNLGNHYTLDDVGVGDFFRLAVSDVIDENFVYIFSIKPDNTSELIFPTRRMVDGNVRFDSPKITSGDIDLEIPVNKRRGLTTDIAGEDHLCILYSSKLIEDINSVIEKVRISNGFFYDRLQLVLGERLINSANISYQNSQMSLSARSSKGYIAPIILRVQVE